VPFPFKDSFTLVISGAALAMSTLAYFQKRQESTQSLRKRLTDIMKELSDLTLKHATFKSLLDKSGYPPNYVGLLADQRRFFVREAATLADALGNEVSPHEKNLIAMTFDSIDLVEDADRFFESAAHMDGTPVDRGLAWRNYGRFLYTKRYFRTAGLPMRNLYWLLERATKEAATIVVLR